MIPTGLLKAVFSFFAVYSVSLGGVQALISQCDKIQNGILFMILKSEGGKLKFSGSNARERKYILVTYSNLIADSY